MSTTPTEDKGAITKDPELIALSKITQLLNGLSEEQRARAWGWLKGKYEPKKPEGAQG